MDAPNAPAGGAQGFQHALDLDRLFHEGDDQTWEMEDWVWDPYHIMAEPKGSPARAHCQAIKRHKSDHRPEPQNATAAQLTANGPAAQQQQQLQQMQGAAPPMAGCHAGLLLPQQQQQQQQQHGVSQQGGFQGLLAEGMGNAAWVQQLQQQALMSQLQQAQALGGAAEGTAAAAVGPACNVSQPGPCSHSSAGPAGRPCQALANGLPFLPPGSWTGLQHQQLHNQLQQQQQQAALCGSMTNPVALQQGAAAAAAGASLTGAGSAPAQLGVPGGVLDHAVSGAQLDLAGLQQVGMMAGLQHQHSHAAAAAAAASAVCSSAADSGSEGVAPQQQQVQAVTQHVQHQAVPPQLVLPGGMAGGGALMADGSPSTITSAGHIIPPAALQQTATAATAGDSEAAASATAVAAAAAAARAPVVCDDGGDGDQKMVCQVQGCGRDLSGLKEYHQRYRICDVHIKLPQVMKDGRLQRFCQQCGRFHDLSAFDGNRKSCREQLQKHNARRRRRAQLEQNMSLADSLLSAVDDKSDVGKLLQGLLSNPFQLQALRVLLGVQTHPALPNPAPQPAEHLPALAAAGSLPPQPQTAAAAAAAAAAAVTGAAPAAAAAAVPSTYEVARDIMDGAGSFTPVFDSEHKSLRLAAKLFNVTPADLPPDLRQQLTGWLAAAPAAVEGYIRPGCVLLTLHMTVGKGEYEEASHSGMSRLLARVLSSTAHPFWHSHVYMLQLFDSVAVVAHGRIVSLSVMSEAELVAHKLPHKLAVSPLCVVGGQAVPLQLAGCNISSADSSLVVKGGGKLLQMSGMGRGKGCGAGGDSCCGCSSKAKQQQAAPAAAVSKDTCGREVASCVVSMPAVSCQVVWVEVARGAFLSQARPLLVVDDHELAQEVAALQQLEGTTLSSEQVDSLLLDLGLVLGHIKSAAASSAIGHAAIAEKARRLIAAACDYGWGAVARAVLPLAHACGACAHDIVAAIHDSTGQDGLSLLHRAVRSGSPALVRGILDWGAAHSYSWPISSGGPGGITPLHLAALLDDDGVVALMLLDACEGVSAFTDAKAADGVSPFHLAFQMGHYSLDRVLAGLGIAPSVSSIVEQQLQPSGWQLLKMAADATDLAAGDDGSVAAAVGAAAAGHGGAPLKERLTSCLDACLYCQSTLPPLLLSIKAKCAGCGVRQPCVQEGDEPCSPYAAAAATAQQQGSRKAAAAAPALPVQGSAHAAGSGDVTAAGCAHGSGRVLSVTALCQTCHANRVLEVA